MNDAGVRLVGVLGRRGRFYVVEPLFERGQRVTVEPPRHDGISEGDIVLVELQRRGRGRVAAGIGRPQVARDVIEGLLLSLGYTRGFEASIAEQATATLPDDVERADLTAMPTFTVDPASARDFDDAISIERAGDHLRLYVHIADVSAFVRPDSVLDGEAGRRGNSVYVPGAVEPMLPDSLSSDACSLVPGEERITVTAEIVLDEVGDVLNARFYRSRIRSDARLDYDRVDDVFAGRGEVPPQVAAELELARKLAAVLRQRRFARGALTVESSEPEFEFDAHGHVRSCRDAVQTEAHGLIEELMILTNEQVAMMLERRRVPTIYRVHEQPDPQSVESLVAQLASLDVPTPPIPDRLTQAQATELIGIISRMLTDYLTARKSRQSPLPVLLLRSLKQAVYATANIGHSGLTSPSYCHFTSPIRRYPDLTVHRSLLGAIGSGPQAVTTEELAQVAVHCSQTERDAADAEHRADDICKCFLLEALLYEQGWEAAFEGQISGVTEGAAFVTFGGLPGGGSCEGFLPARRLRGDWYDLNEPQTALIGREGGGTIRIGDPVTVRVRSLDPPRGRVDLEPVRQS